MSIRTVLGVILIIVALAGWYLLSERRQEQAALAGSAMVEVTVPDLTEPEAMGATAFAAKCAECHGENAAGKDGVGPPLVHKIYEPGHHGDASIYNAVRNGVRAHHWSFGAMQPVEGLTDAEIGTIIAYIRKLQAANGIY
ncbi:cytochrome c [Defluviimonas sp. WL0002]|uniref:Cytochrome c n=1 Tax=Albidovulum marisflavi TaxID=2984159 RepID=A0ABT2ZF25_9RHOB|nr:cytochrome c [Defluviimonas sp. WL0002]MCV2869745.1 cytochrome c [Defluviimonas sp. WL0002]